GVNPPGRSRRQRIDWRERGDIDQRQPVERQPAASVGPSRDAQQFDLGVGGITGVGFQQVVIAGPRAEFPEHRSVPLAQADADSPRGVAGFRTGSEGFDGDRRGSHRKLAANGQQTVRDRIGWPFGLIAGLAGPTIAPLVQGDVQ
ncbi:hypothetical protein RZS08_16445, partial [Arthrospira platensis SPKY1]|nr:hypothetical protein [Arthrospira platensis SPKY1]